MDKTQLDSKQLMPAKIGIKQEAYIMQEIHDSASTKQDMNSLFQN